jgi:hypothetical protein
LRSCGKIKDDAIAQLSDQLMAISTRLQELEGKQAKSCKKKIVYLMVEKIGYRQLFVFNSFQNIGVYVQL